MNPVQARLTRRAILLRAIREYFHEESVLEVVTPVLRDYGTSEIHLQNLSFEHGYLQTSPEYAMKCLLAEIGGSIYQICPAFRGGESGQRHRSEFQMLEWYRVGYSLDELMTDLEHLLAAAMASLALPDTDASTFPFRRFAYKELFHERFGICPHTASDSELRKLCQTLPDDHLDNGARRADLLDALFSLGVEPRLNEPTLVYDYPASQAALAEVKTDGDGCQVADRFECYLQGMEIANAYQELNDAAELRERFRENNVTRLKLGKPEVPDDVSLLNALGKMPACAGAALGVDRLLMALIGESDISRV